MVLKVSLNTGVLIESDWNLKWFIVGIQILVDGVLIESDWNLKIIETHSLLHLCLGINRIRLEFKGREGTPV